MRSEHTLSLREQLLLVGVAAPLAVLILVLAPYYFAHYYVYKDAYLLAPAPPIGGARALEGHWTDVASAPVKPFKFVARTGDESSEALAVPIDAVLFENGFTRVWVVGEDKSRILTPRTIRTGRIADGMVEVVDGLTRDDQVATSDVVFIDRAAKGY